MHSRSKTASGLTVGEAHFATDDGLDEPLDCIDSLSDGNQARLVVVLDQYLIDIEEGRQVDIPSLLSENADLAGPLQHYIDGLQLVRKLSQASEEDLLYQIPSTRRAELPLNGTFSRESQRVTQRLGPYELGEIIGRGAMGVVYRAYDARRQRQVALKVLAFASAVESSRIDRFRREAQTAAALNHPNVVPVYAVGCDSGVNYYAMQLVEGASLDHRLFHARETTCGTIADVNSPPNDSQRLAGPLLGPDRYRRIALLCANAADALDAAHRAGVIHRDVKPSNLLLGNDGQLWVTDFGLARVQAETGLTKTGELIGTVRYMSPEQANGHGDMIDARTDVYGLGATLYELVTGTPPFPGDNMLELLRLIQTSEPPSPHQFDASVPRDLETIIRRAMRPRALDRYPTAAAMAEDLRRFAEGKRILAHSVSLVERWGVWALRHRRLVTGVLVLWASILAISLGTSVLLLRAQARTTAALQKSEEHYRQARRIVDSLGSSVAKRLVSIPEAEGLRQEILAETIQHYQQFIAASADDPNLMHDVTRTQLEKARLTALADSYPNAELAYQAVLVTYGLDHVGIDDPANSSLADESTETHGSIGAIRSLNSSDELLLCAQALNEWGLLASEHGHHLKAQLRFETALDLLSKPLLLKPTATTLAIAELDVPVRFALAQALTHNNLGVIKLRQSRLEESAAELQQAIAIMQRLPAETLQSERLAGDVSDAFSNLSVMLGEANQYSAAVQAAEQSLAIRQQTQPTQLIEHQFRLAVTYNNLAAFHWKSHRMKEALAAYRQAADLLDNTVRQAPSRADIRQRLAVTLNNFGMALATHCRSDRSVLDTSAAKDAEHVFQRAATLAQQFVASDPTNAAAARQLAGIQNNLAVHLQHQTRFVEANQWLNNAASLLRSLPNEQHETSSDTSLLKQIEANLKMNP